MKFSIIGSRGIPAKYGGYEVFAEQIATRLAQKGFSVTVCCEFQEEKVDTYQGVHLENFPFPPPQNYTLRKFYETLSDIYFMIKMARSSDLMYVCGTTAGGVMFIPKLLNRKMKLFVNIGGLEWKRDKWSKLERLFLKINTQLATVFADSIIIDSKSMRKYVGKNWRDKTVFVPYGAEIPQEIAWDKNKLDYLTKRCKNINSINKNEYWLEIARLEPDNNIHIVLEGYLKSGSNMRLVVIGDYTSEKYKKVLENIIANDNEGRVLMLGGIYGDGKLLEMLRQNCYAYIHAHSFGGTNPSLLEAMASKIIILANDNEFNREVCADSACYFKTADELAQKIDILEKDNINFKKLKNQVYGRAKTKYSWEKIVNEYEDLFKLQSSA